MPNLFPRQRPDNKQFYLLILKSVILFSLSAYLAYQASQLMDKDPVEARKKATFGLFAAAFGIIRVILALREKNRINNELRILNHPQPVIPLQINPVNPAPRDEAPAAVEALYLAEENNNAQVMQKRAAHSA